MACGWKKGEGKAIEEHSKMRGQIFTASPVLMALLLLLATGCAPRAESAGGDGHLRRACRQMVQRAPRPCIRLDGRLRGDDHAVAVAESAWLILEGGQQSAEGAPGSGCFRAASMMPLRGGGGEESERLPSPLGLNETMIEMLRKVGEGQGGGSRIAVNQTILDMIREMGPGAEELDNVTIADKMTSWEGKMVCVELEQGFEMRGKLIHLDDGMNAMLAGPVERYDVESGELLGTDVEDILVKGSNVIHVALMEGMVEVEQDVDE